MSIISIKSVPKFGLFLAVFLLFTITSCTKEKDFDFNKMAQNTYESEWAVPVINKKYTLSDLILDTMSYVISDPNDQFLTVVYNTGDLWSFTAEQMLTLPDLSQNKTQNITAPSSVSAGTYWEGSYTTQIDLNFSTYDLDSMLLKGGLLTTNINTNINHPAQIIVTIPGVTNGNGDTLSFSLNMPYSGGTEMASGSSTSNLSGYKLNVQTGNKVDVNYTVKVLGDSYPFSTPTYNIQVNTQFTDLKYKYMVGYFGQLTQNLVDTASIRLFKAHYENSMLLKEFRAHLFMKNSFGMPIRFRINKYIIYTGGTERDVITPGYTVDGPYPTLSQFGQTITKHDTVLLNPAMLEISPKYQAFNADGMLNPDNNSNIKNFIRDDSKFSVDARLELPMEGKIMSFAYRDTLEFHFENIDAIEYTNFRLYVENAFPINGLMQVYFADSSYHIVDSLLTQQSIIPSANIGPAPSFYTSSNGVKTMDILVNKERISRIGNTKWLIVDVHLSSTNYANQFIRIYGNQYIYVILGTKVKINATY